MTNAWKKWLVVSMHTLTACQYSRLRYKNIGKQQASKVVYKWRVARPSSVDIFMFSFPLRKDWSKINEFTSYRQMTKIWSSTVKSQIFMCPNHRAPRQSVYKEQSTAKSNSFKIAQKTAFGVKGRLYTTGKVIQRLFIIDLYTYLAICRYRWSKR